MDSSMFKDCMCCIGLGLVQVALVGRYTAAAADIAELACIHLQNDQAGDQVFFGGSGYRSDPGASTDSGFANSYYRLLNFATEHLTHIGFGCSALLVVHQFENSSKLPKINDP